MFIDLTHRLNNETPVYPGDADIVITEMSTLEKNGYLGHALRLGTHSGTHIDAPAHMLAEAKSLGMFDVDAFIGPGRYILLEQRQFTIEAVMRARIQAGDIVIFDTQSSYHFRKPEYFTDFPAMSEEIAQYLVDKKVKMVGVDTCSVDNKPGYPNHKILLANNILLIENLTNIEQLSGHSPTIYALPIKIDTDGAPARVIAEIH